MHRASVSIPLIPSTRATARVPWPSGRRSRGGVYVCRPPPDCRVDTKPRDGGIRPERGRGCWLLGRVDLRLHPLVMLLRTAAAALSAVAGTAIHVAGAVGERPVAGSVELVESSEAGAHWKKMPPLQWEADEFAAEVAVTAQLEERKQRVMGFGSAMTDTSAYNAMVWMDDRTRSAFFEALWGKTGLGLSVGRVTLNSADYSFQSFNCAMRAAYPRLRIRCLSAGSRMHSVYLLLEGARACARWLHAVQMTT